jgi:hypothetical protein
MIKRELVIFILVGMFRVLISPFDFLWLDSCSSRGNRYGESNGIFCRNPVCIVNRI